jgi:molecular chaperone GrpE (heat shock protein)
VGFEFHRRRDDILRKNAAAYKALSEKISEQLLKVIDALDSDARFARHPYIQMGDFRKKVKESTISY